MQFVKESIIAATPETVFAFHERPDAFELLVPPWENATVVQKADISVIGSRAVIETRLFGIVPVRWVAEHTAYDPPRMFEDVQISGPFASWRHQHIVLPHPDGAVLRDEIEFEPPMRVLGRLAAPFAIIPKIQKMFDFRHAATIRAIETETNR